MPAKILKGMKPTLPTSVVKPASKYFPTPQPQKIEMVQPQAEIHKTYPDGTETTVKEDVGGPIQKVGQQANVGVNMGMTIPTVKFGNFKFSVSLFIPCAVDVDEINETYLQVKEWVEGRVEEVSDEVAAQMDGAVGTEVGAQE
jgi:hypothetical protein